MGMSCSECVFVSTQDGWTALHVAAQEGKVDVVRLLLTEAQALVNIQTKVHSHHITTLSTALTYKSRECEQYVCASCILYHVQWCVWRCKDVLTV